MTPKSGYSKKKNKNEYRIFLKSSYWKRVRKKVLQRDNYTCTRCGYKNNLQVHHLSYEHHNYEHMHLDDLVTLCRKCHELLHKIESYAKKVNK